MSGETLSPGDVLVRDGKIAAVSKSLPTRDAKVIELKGQHVYPGLIALNSGLGLTEIEAVRATRDEREVGDFTPDVESWIAVNPDSELLPVARANGLAILGTASGIGGLAGAIVSANMGHEPRKGLLMFLGGSATGMFLLLFALTPSFELAAFFLGANGIGMMLFQTTNNTVMQATVPHDLRGRVNSLMLMSFGITPLGVLPITAIADSAGAPATVAGSSITLIVLLTLVFIFVAPIRKLRLDALERAELSPAQAAALVAEGKLTQEDADRLTGMKRSTPGRAPAAGV